jgi:hypothetical protein
MRKNNELKRVERIWKIAMRFSLADFTSLRGSLEG